MNQQDHKDRMIVVQEKALKIADKYKFPLVAEYKLYPSIMRTKVGLFLRVDHGIPAGMYTPFGLWQCWTVEGDPSDEAKEAFMKEFFTYLGLSEYHPDLDKALSLVGFRNLPQVSYLPQDDYDDDDIVLKLWVSLD